MPCGHFASRQISFEILMDRLFLAKYLVVHISSNSSRSMSGLVESTDLTTSFPQPRKYFCVSKRSLQYKLKSTEHVVLQEISGPSKTVGRYASDRMITFRAD
jgi:hypothetical protein